MLLPSTYNVNICLEDNRESFRLEFLMGKDGTAIRQELIELCSEYTLQALLLRSVNS